MTRSISAKQSLQWLWWLLIVVLCAVPLWVGYQLCTGLPYDDAFITFTYVRNVAEGHGFVYNGGTPYLGTTTPLLTLLLAAIKRILFSAEIYSIANWVGAILWAMGGTLAYLLGRKIVGPAGGVMLTALHISSSIYPYVLGSEYPLLISLGFIYLAMLGHYWAAGIVVGLAFLTRGDAAVLAGLLGLTLLLRDRRVLWGFSLGFILTLLPWLIYGFTQFGNPLPATLALKRAHRAIGAWPSLTYRFLAVG